MGKTVLFNVLRIAMCHVKIYLDHVNVLKKVQKVKAPKVIINIENNSFIHNNFFKCDCRN